MDFKKIIILGVTAISGRAFANSPVNTLISKTVCGVKDTGMMSFVSNRQLFEEQWDTLPQVKFWQQVVKLNADTAIINIAASRTPVQKIAFSDWSCRADCDKSEFKKFVCLANNLDTATNLYVTSGKREFYEYKRVIPTISQSVIIFQENHVDPWYAQSILLIENPGKNANKSSVGANGPFQLMREVAKRYGLKVNGKIDERTNLTKAAFTASQLIKNSCIPKVKSCLDKVGLTYNETDLWFRLLVLHAYHAGPGNVACVINQLNPSKGGIDLFTKIWQTECGGFKNESQNYSQIALANLVVFEKFINQNKDSVWLVEGERQFAEYKKTKKTSAPKIDLLKNSMESYSDDLIDGTIPADFFISRMEKIQSELAAYKKSGKLNEKTETSLSMNRFLAMGGNLMRKRQLDDAIKILKLNIEHYPNCVTAYDSLSRIYKLQGKTQLALMYNQKGAAIKEPVY